MKKVFLLIFCNLLLCSYTFAVPKGGPKNKFGANYNVISGTKYSLTSKTTSDSSYSGSSGGSASGSENIVGAVIIYENVLSSKFAWGLKFGAQLSRNMELELGTTTLNVEETTSYWLLDVKAYHKDHMSGGLKPFLAVGFGNMSITSTITDSSSSETDETSETSASVPITTLSGGVDYFMNAGGFRLEGGLITGEKSDLESNDSYSANYQMTGGYVNIGVFWLF